MNPWIVLPALLALALLFVVAPVVATTFTQWRRPWRLTCPRTGTEAQIRVAAARAAVAAVFGETMPGIERCSLWPAVRGCREECRTLPPGAMRPMRRGAPPPRPEARSGLHTILVPLDGAPGSETVLHAVGELVRRHGATVRFVHVVKPVKNGWTDAGGRVITFVDQECERVETQTRAYFKDLAARLPGVTVESAVRFGDPVTEIVDEAESAGVDLIAMACHRRPGLGLLLRRSLARRIERETTIPLLLVPYDERAAA